MTPEALESTDTIAGTPPTGRTIVLNGERRRIAAGATVSALLEELDLPAERVAVELDGEILKRSQWSATEPAEGARLEVVHFVGGG